MSEAERERDAAHRLLEEARAEARLHAERATSERKRRKVSEARVRDLDAMMRTLLLYVGHIPNDGTKMFAAVKQAQELLVAK